MNGAVVRYRGPRLRDARSSTSWAGVGRIARESLVRSGTDMPDRQAFPRRSRRSHRSRSSWGYPQRRSCRRRRRRRTSRIDHGGGFWSPSRGLPSLGSGTHAFRDARYQSLPVDARGRGTHEDCAPRALRRSKPKETSGPRCYVDHGLPASPRLLGMNGATPCSSRDSGT